MIRNVIICNRCGQECRGSTYYTFYIYADDIHPSNDGSVSYDTAVQNTNTNISRAIGNNKHYCADCKREIDMFMSKKVKPNFDMIYLSSSENKIHPSILNELLNLFRH